VAILNVNKKFLKNFFFSKYVFRISFEKLNYLCPVCNKKTKFEPIDEYYLKNWQKFNFRHSIFCLETFNILSYKCCRCGVNDRYRLIALYLKNYFSYSSYEIYFLEIGYSPYTKKILKQVNFFKIFYFVLDNNYTKANYKEDIENKTTIPSEKFDIILCSHVLEHTFNPDKALKEIYRILKKNGIAIFLAPILINNEKFFTITENLTEKEKWEYFGDKDHYHIFTKIEFVNMLKSNNFIVNEYDIFWIRHI